MCLIIMLVGTRKHPKRIICSWWRYPGKSVVIVSITWQTSIEMIKLEFSDILMLLTYHGKNDSFIVAWINIISGSKYNRH